jgi:hypothetical protein
MRPKDVTVIPGFIIVDPTEPLNIVNDNNIKRANLGLGIFDHLLKGPSSNGAGTADGIVNIEFKKL